MIGEMRNRAGATVVSVGNLVLYPDLRASAFAALVERRVKDKPSWELGSRKPFLHGGVQDVPVSSMPAAGAFDGEEIRRGLLALPPLLRS